MGPEVRETTKYFKVQENSLIEWYLFHTLGMPSGWKWKSESAQVQVKKWQKNLDYKVKQIRQCTRSTGEAEIKSVKDRLLGIVRQ